MPGATPIPYGSGDAGISNPRNPSTGAPLWRIRQSIPDRHKKLYFRHPDRGAYRPTQGEPAPYVPGTRDQGGIPRGVYWKGAMADLGKLPIVRQSYTAAKFATLAADHLRRNTIRQSRPGITLFAGLGGLDVAQAPRAVPGATGKPAPPSGMRGILRDMRPPTERGLFAQHRTAPAFVTLLDRFRPPARLANTAAPTAAPTDPRPSGASLQLAVTSSLAASTASDETGKPGPGVLYLIGAVALAWLVFRH